MVILQTKKSCYTWWSIDVYNLFIALYAWFCFLCLQTEMTTAERELDHNTNFDWNRIQESGKDAEPLYGPGYTGLVNLGNRYHGLTVRDHFLFL